MFINSLSISANRIPVLGHIAAVIASYFGFSAAKSALDSFFAASGYPVDYATGQLSFSAEKLAEYYGSMVAGGTLDIYVKTQIIDFAFIAGFTILGIALGTLMMRFSCGRWTRLLGVVVVGFAMIGGLFDSFENFASFVMLADPANINAIIALIYSSFAAVKFASLTVAMASAALWVVASVLGRILGCPNRVCASS